MRSSVFCPEVGSCIWLRGREIAVSSQQCFWITDYRDIYSRSDFQTNVWLASSSKVHTYSFRGYVCLLKYPLLCCCGQTPRLLLLFKVRNTIDFTGMCSPITPCALFSAHHLLRPTMLTHTLRSLFVTLTQDLTWDYR